MNAAWSERLEIARFLSDNGADVNAKNESGATVLGFASGPKQTKMVEYLKAHGAK